MSLRSRDGTSDENEQVRMDLAARVRKLVESAAGTVSLLKVHDWAILDFSSCFSIEWMRQQSRWGVFVKIPKTSVNRKTVLPTCEGDRVLGRNEYASLTYLERHWNGSEARVDYVKPLAFFEDCNAIVTERTYAWELLGPFRRSAIWRRGPGDEMVDILRRIGLALRIFHRRSQATDAFHVEPFDGGRVIQKIGRIVDDLLSAGVRQPLTPNDLSAVREWATYRREVQPTMTLKGLDVRNMFADGEGRISLLDPGRLKKDAPEADLARLLATVQILYWGTLVFFLRAQPAPRYEGALLAGYDDACVDHALLRLLVVKELLKHWRQAYEALDHKNWPRPVKWMLSRTYIDSFYRAETARAISRLRATAQGRLPAARA